jgi:hypothetical protein
MAKRKQAAAPEPSPVPQVGDKVRPGRSEMVYEISHVSKEGNEVNLHVPGTNLERFRVQVSDLTFVERKAPVRTSNPFTSPEPSTAPKCWRRSPPFNERTFSVLMMTFLSSLNI